MGDWGDYGTGTASAWVNQVTYTINGNGWGDASIGYQLARPGEIESALQWLDRRVAEVCVKL